MNTVFISYARDDDEPFVVDLYKKLIDEGVKVWWDKEKMLSRGRSFLQEIKDAISEADYFVLVVGPEASISEYVIAEWTHALNYCKVIIPVLRIGDFELIPFQLKNLHSVDFRTKTPYSHAFDELLRHLNESLKEIGEIISVPSLPPHHLPIQRLQQNLNFFVLKDLNQPAVLDETKKITVLTGMGGAGKSVVAAFFARDCTTRRAFYDGIIWVKSGQKINLENQSILVGRALGINNSDFKNLPQRLNEIETKLVKKTSLLIFDDVWELADVEWIINVLGKNVRLLVTTRNVDLASVLAANHLPVPLFDLDSSQQLLGNWTESYTTELPVITQSILEECGYLPFAISLCGALAKEGMSWQDILDSLLEADLSFIERSLPNYPFPNILKSLQISVDALEQVDKNGKDCYLSLAVFANDIGIHEKAIVQFWTYYFRINARNARRLLRVFYNRSLLRIEENESDAIVFFHDLQHDYLTASNDKAILLHEKLIQAYNELCQGVWGVGPNDGYYFQKLPYHLLEAKRIGELNDLLFDYSWIKNKLAFTNIVSLLADYSYVESSSAKKLLKESLLLSANALSIDKEQIGGQLYARLQIFYQEKEIKRLLDQIVSNSRSPWLKLINPSLNIPGTQLLYSISNQHCIIDAVIQRDKNALLTIDKEGWINCRNLDSGMELWKNHLEPVFNIFTFSRSGEKGVSVKNQKEHSVIYCWKLCETIVLEKEVVFDLLITQSKFFDDTAFITISDAKDKEIEKTIINIWRFGETSPVKSSTLSGLQSHLAVSGDGAFALSASYFGIISLVNLKTFEISERQIDCGIWSVALSQTGRYAAFSTMVRFFGSDASERSDRELLYTEKDTAILQRFKQLENDWKISGEYEDESENSIYLIDFQYSNSENFVNHYLGKHLDKIESISFSIDSNYIATASWDRNWKLFDVNTKEELQLVRGHDDIVMNVLFSTIQNEYISFSKDSSIKSWNLQHKKALKEQEFHNNSVLGLQIIDTTHQAASVSRDGTLKLWNFQSGLCDFTFEEPGAIFNALTAIESSNKVLLAAVSSDRSIHIWEVGLRKKLGILKGHSADVISLRFVNSNTLVSSSSSGELILWDINTFSIKVSKEVGFEDKFSGKKGFAKIIDIDETDEQILVSDYGEVPDLGKGMRSILIRDTNDLESIKVLNSVFVTWKYFKDAIFFNKAYVLLAVYLGVIKVWNRKAPEEIIEIKAHEGHIVSIYATPDINCFLSIGEDKTIKKWDIRSQSLVWGIEEKLNLKSLKIFNNRYFISICEDGIIQIRNLDNGRIVSGFMFDNKINCCQVVEMEKRIIVGDDQGRVHFMELS